MEFMKNIFLGFFLILFSSLAFSSNSLFFENNFSNQDKPLKAEEAFAYFYDDAPDAFVFKFSIANNYYLYKDKIKVYFNNKEQPLDYIFSIPKTKEDSLFGKVNVLEGNVSFKVSKDNLYHLKNIEVKIEYQGCAEKLALCYPKEEKKFIYTNKNYKANFFENISNSLEDGYYFKDILSEKSLLVIMLSVFLIGLVISFTPCILPIYPLVITIITKDNKKYIPIISYVIGYCCAYFMIGVVFSLYKINIQLLFQKEYVFYIVSFLFLLLALTSFSVIKINLGNKWSLKVNNILDKLYEKNNGLNVFFIGFFSALIISPCAIAPVSGILIWINQINSLFFGSILLFALALGMMIPFIFLSLFSKKIKIKSRNLVFFKYLIGYSLIYVSIYIFSKTGQQFLTNFFYSVLTCYILLNFFIKNKKLIIGIVLIPCIIFAVFYKNNSQEYYFYNQIEAKSIQEIKEELAKSKGKEKVIINIHADWCLECQRMKQTTFKDKTVLEALKEFKVVNVDVSKNDNIKEILDYFNLQTVPIYVLYNSNGIKNDKYLLGYVENDKFIDIINNIK